MHLDLGVMCGCASLEDQMVAKEVTGRLDFVDFHTWMSEDCALEMCDFVRLNARIRSDSAGI